jgi:PAS domain S-box-containing protein
MKISNKISLSFLITGIILTTIAASIAYTMFRNNMEKAILEHLRTTARSRANHIETFLEDHKQTTELVASGLIFQELLSTSKGTPEYNKKLEIVSSRINTVITANKEILEISLLDKNGTVVASTDQASVGSDKSADNTYLKAKESTYIAGIHIYETSGIPDLDIATPVLLNGEPLGVIIADLNTEELFKITLDRTGLGETGEIYLVNKDFYMISPSRFKEDVILRQKVDTINAKNCLMLKGKEHIPGREEIAVFPDYRGTNVLGTHAYISMVQWGLLAEIDEKEALAPLDRIRLLFVIILIFVPIAAWLIGVFLSKRISGPIIKLHKGTEIIGAGNLDYKVGTDSKDEIGQLSKAFDKMTDGLKKTTASIVDLNREIEERKRAEEAIKVSEEKFRTLFEYSRDAIYINTKEGEFIDVNQSFLDLFGYTREEMAGRNAADDYANPDDRLRFTDELAQKGFIKDFEVKYKKKNGTEMDCLVTATGQQSNDGSILRYQGIIRDITERKKAEEALRKAGALETLSTVLENFIGDSLSNLLTPIYGGIELCEIRDSIEQIKGELGNIKGNITKLLTGISAYRKFTKAGEGSLGKISSVDISSILGPFLSGQPLKTYGGEEFPIDPKVKLQFTYNPKQKGSVSWEELPSVSGSKLAVATALQETLINAVESYDPKKGGDVVVSVKKEDHNLILEIADKGRGMSNEDRDKSQLPFFKVLGVKGSGRLGLGAYIALESAKYCEGDIHIKSREGVGTTASIILKISDKVS